MNIFDLREQLVRDYGDFIRGFLKIRDRRLNAFVHAELDRGVLWPEPWISLNPGFESGGWIDELVEEGTLHPECKRIFRVKTEQDASGRPLRLHRHQAEAVHAASLGDNYVLTTGTGSGKSLAYIVPIVDRVLREGSGRGIRAIVVYPMNALANSQAGELRKFLKLGYPDGRSPVTFRRYTGQENDEERHDIIANPPDILLTNYVMAELILTRVHERGLVRAAHGLEFLVLDELHTYRGRQGADVAMLVRRIRDACAAEILQCIGTSATLASAGSFEQQRQDVAAVASRLFGTPVIPERVIGETLRRTTAEIEGPIAAARAALAARVSEPVFAEDFEGFVADPLASWLENTFGLRADDSGRLVRATPVTVGGWEGAAQSLAAAADVDEESAARAIRAGLLAGCRVIDPESGALSSRSGSTSSSPEVTPCTRPWGTRRLATSRCRRRSSTQPTMIGRGCCCRSSSVGSVVRSTSPLAAPAQTTRHQRLSSLEPSASRSRTRETPGSSTSPMTMLGRSTRRTISTACRTTGSRT